jgi:glucose/arabinose dehydrogenase
MPCLFASSRWALLVVACLAGTAGFLHAQVSVAGGFAAEVVVNPVAGGRAMAFAPDGRLFYTEFAGGRIMVVNDPTGAATTPEEFATVSGLVSPGGNDAGLHGIALHPAFPLDPGEGANRFLYVCHTTGTPGSPRRLALFAGGRDGS